MNFGHRLADRKKFFGLAIAFRRIEYPLNFLIPGLIIFLSALSAFPNFGQNWEVGSFSTQVIPRLAVALARLINAETSVILSDLVLVGYLLMPLTAYILVKTISKRHLSALLTALWLIVPMWPLSHLPPGRLSLALVDADGAHILALTILPLCSLAYLQFIRTGNKISLAILALILEAVSLVSFFGLFITWIVFLFLTISEILLNQGKLKIKRSLVVLGLTLIIIVVTYNVFFWSILTSGSGRVTLAVLYNFFPITFVLLPILGVMAFLIFDRRPQLQSFFVSLGLLLTFSLLHIVRISFVDIPILDRNRYLAELEFALAFFSGVFVMWLFELIRGGRIVKRWRIIYQLREPLAFSLVVSILILLISTSLFISREIY